MGDPPGGRLNINLNIAQEGLVAGRGGGRFGRRDERERKGIYRGTAPRAALRRHVKDKHVKDAAQNVAQDVAQDLAQDVAENVLGAAGDGSAKMLIFSCPPP